jgi:hypothetical protein
MTHSQLHPPPLQDPSFHHALVMTHSQLHTPPLEDPSLHHARGMTHSQLHTPPFRMRRYIRMHGVDDAVHTYVI